MTSRNSGRRTANGGGCGPAFCVSVSFAVLFALLPAGVRAAAGIVPDGATSTTVTTAANGRQTVNIAPATGGVSQNTYSAFNVGASGATLNNTGINARTIVNQVTSTNPSLIQGDITVSGPRANVVIANPNGITINGGSFVNTGRVALTTGQVSFNDVQIGGVLQRNVVLNTTGGTITVGPQGLASTLIGLDLIAKNVLVNGPVNNNYTSPTAYTRIVAGTSQTTLDTGVSPGDNGSDWLSVQSGSSVSTANSFAVDISAAGSLTSGRIQLIVTDAGPGVRSAGAMNATLGDFTLSSNGSVEFNDMQANASVGPATLTAAGPITFTGSSLTATGGVKLSGNGVSLLTDAHGGSALASGTAGVVIKSSGDVTNVGSLVQGVQATAGDADSVAAVTVNATGNILNQSLPATGLGVFFGSGGDVSLTAGGAVTNENARILSNANVSITAGGDFNNVSDRVDGANGGTLTGYSNHGHSLIFVSRRSDGFSIDYGTLTDPNKLAFVKAQSMDANGTTTYGAITIHANNVSNVGGSILADGGAISVTAKDALLNQGVFTGTASYNRSCFFLCHASASSTVQAFGGVIESGTDINLKAGTQITNVGGVVMALGGSLTLDAPKTLAKAVLGYTALNRANDMKAWFGSKWAAIYAADTGGIFEAGNGQVHLTGEADIDGGLVSGTNGVAADGGIVTIRARYTQPVTVGNGNHIGLVSWFGL